MPQKEEEKNNSIKKSDFVKWFSELNKGSGKVGRNTSTNVSRWKINEPTKSFF